MLSYCYSNTAPLRQPIKTHSFIDVLVEASFILDKANDNYLK